MPLDTFDFAVVVLLGIALPEYTTDWVDPGYPISDPAPIQQTVASVLAGTGD